MDSATRPALNRNPKRPKGKLAYNSPGSRTTIFGAHNGVVTYVPGYEVSISTVGMQKETVGTLWSVPEIKPLVAVAGRVSGTNTFGQLLAPDTHPLLAKAQLFPNLIPRDTKGMDWKLWYDRVSAAIYGRWKYADVGPGTATVRVTVRDDKQVHAEVIDFEPAPDVARDATAETAFRETALHAVNLVTTAEIPNFPANANTTEVKFDVEMRRLAETRSSEQQVTAKMLDSAN
jgi:hypothetical protein